MDDPGATTANRRTRRQRGLALVGTSVLLLSLFACGGDDDEADASNEEEATSGQDAEDLLGPEDVAEGEPIRLGMVSDGTTDAFDNTDELRSAEAAAEFWNTHRGGLDGRPIEVVPCETGADPAGGTDCANQMVEQDVVVAHPAELQLDPGFDRPGVRVEDDDRP